MSFNFGSSAGGSGFPFTAPKTVAATVSGFTFGNNPGGPQGSFGFGTAPQALAGASSSAGNASLFSFSTANTTSTSSTGFCVPTQPAAATSTSGGFSLGMNKTNLGFGGTANQPISSFSFGNVPAASTSTTTSCPSLSSGSIAQTTAPTGFSFGTSTTQPTVTSFGLNSACSTAQTTTSTGFGFTSTPAAPTQNTAASGFNFGTVTNGTPTLAGFSFSTPATTTVPKPAAPLSLGAQSAGFAFGPVTVASGTTTSAPATQGFSFGAKAAGALTSAPATGSTLFASVVSSVPPATSVTTGFTLTSSAAAAPTPATSTTSAPFGFKPTSTTLPVTTATPIASTSATATITSTGFSLGLKTPASFSLTPGPVATTTSVITTAITTTPAVITTAAAITATITTTSAAPTTSSAPPVMSYTQLESLINKWSVELEDQEKQFLLQATQVNAWDRMLIENGEKITALHREAEKVKLDQKRLDQELDFILSQQKELEDLLAPLEQSVRDQHGTIYLQHADEEREHTYKLAENIDAQLKRMAQDLKEIIQHLNTTSSSLEVSDPLQQICKILNAHMDSLQWIDQSSVLLQKKVEDVSKQFEMRRREQERNCRITFD